MKTTVFVFHPHMSDSVVNKALAKAAEGAQVDVRYMYEIYPDGKIDVKAEQKILEATDRIVLQFPFYWYSCPPLLKQWEDEVFEHGWAYGSTGTALHGKELMLALSTGAKAEDYTKGSRFDVTIDELVLPFKATSQLIGTTWLKPFVTYGTLGMETATLEAQTKAYMATLK
ncbi:NAD(P)H-dependent oxidoreductase [Veillonella criceti]|uniref:General stress protein 14 n=1 Tax=Veillonella criceti TaxID=103891 RepID=A0A380NI94_9FIRM|nr:NAD(P)H-dependent oxidoreductase [Veillonella criceti]SUP41747.1 General stress protein 14 [Veillonella criceti]